MGIPHRNRRNFLKLAGAATLAALPGRHVLAESWPARPIKYVVPWPAGGPTDIFGRVLASELSSSLGQPVVVENKAGATGAIATRFVARSEADGYTLLAANTTSFIGNVVSAPEVAQFDPLKDFVPIGLFVETAYVLWAHPSLQVRNFDEFLTVARDGKRPPLAFGTTGNGAISELSVEQLARRYKLNLLKVPYKGTAPQVADLLAGHTQIGTSDLPAVNGLHTTGKLIPLLVIGRRRLPELPNIPTSFELGIREPDFTVWNGLFAPAGTSPAIVAKLTASLAQAVRSEAFKRVAEGNGNHVLFLSGKEATARIQSDFAERLSFKKSLDQA